MLKDFSIWQEYQGASEGSGRSEKIWLVNPVNGEIGLFKFPKTEHTTEHLSEKIAADLATLIKIPCMKVELGMYRGRIGSLSYRLNQVNENLIEGIQLINRYYPYYNEETLYDSQKDEYYSLDMILHSLAAYDLQKDFLAICTFDFPSVIPTGTTVTGQLCRGSKILIYVLYMIMVLLSAVIYRKRNWRVI